MLAIIFSNRCSNPYNFICPYLLWFITIQVDLKRKWCSLTQWCNQIPLHSKIKKIQKKKLAMTLVWSSNRRVDFPAERSHRRRVLSHDPERAKWPSDDRTTSETKWEWPYKRFWGTPKLFSSRVNFQTIKVLSNRTENTFHWTIIAHNMRILKIKQDISIKIHIIELSSSWV